MASGRTACRKKESSFSVEEDFVSDDDPTHPFSQKKRNDRVCVHLKTVKLLLGQQSGFTKFPRCHGRWDAAMTNYCWTLKRDVPAAFKTTFKTTLFGRTGVGSASE